MANITSFEDLKKYSEGQIVELPDFAHGQPFVARLKRPSMLALAESGAIPNNLLSTAAKLFEEQSSNENENEDVDKSDKVKSKVSGMYPLMVTMAKASLIEPTYDDIEKAGLELTDAQLLFIFEYSQSGAKEAEPFREE